ncbi:MAG TPA: DUF3175 domain-containing protein [Polyangiaceae bacterium]|jgi:hypothetical protein|nr:DUF3175 domain-containing protein [Polyangiaceae bacterium]
MPTTTKAKSTTRRTAKAAKRPARRYWSKQVTKNSDALDLEQSVFTKSPSAIARSLKRSAERSGRRKSSPFRAAMSMLTFYENRAGKNLSATRKQTIDRAKDELRRLFGKSTTPAAKQ